MVGAGETYFVAFALAAGMSETFGGLLASIPLFLGSLLQLSSMRMTRLLGSLQRWVVLCASVQAISFLPLAIGAMRGSIDPWLIYLCVSIYWGSNLAAGPAWNTWIGTIVPGSIRARYFSNRARFAHMGILAGLAGGGMTLHALRGDDTSRLWPFAILFFGACMMRLVSVVLLAKHSEPVPIPGDHRDVPVRSLVGRLHSWRGGRLILFMLAMQFCVHISASFFAPYMLKKLDLPYHVYMMLLSAAYIGRTLSLGAIGRLAKRFGAHAILWIGGIGIMPLSAAWLVSDSVWYLLPLQLLTGVLWGCYEIGTFLILLESVPENERTSILTTQNLLNSCAVILGAAIGGVIMRLGHEQVSAYFTVFALSGVARVLTLPLLARVHPITTPTGRVPTLIFRTLGVRPNFGAVDRPYIASAEGGEATEPAPAARVR
jgi:MFS family permease